MQRPIGNLLFAVFWFLQAIDHATDLWIWYEGGRTLSGARVGFKVLGVAVGVVFGVYCLGRRESLFAVRGRK
jgi:hypothetical protein